MLARHIPGIIIIYNNSLKQIMVNKCAALGDLVMPRTKQNILQSFIFFWKLLNWTDHGFDLSTATIGSQQNSVFSELHFEENYIVRGGKSNLKWSMNSIPTKHSKELQKVPSSLLPTRKTTWKPHRERLISNDQMDIFRERDTITSLADLDETTAPDGFQFKKSEEHALFFNLVFDKETKCSTAAYWHTSTFTTMASART